MRMRTNIAFGAIGISYAIVVAMILGACGLPFSKNWQIYPNPGSMFFSISEGDRGLMEII